MASDFGPADLNKDGETTPKEKRVYKRKQAAANTAAAAAPATGQAPDKLNMYP